MKIAIITHTDLDGIGGAALYTVLRNASLNDIEILFSEPRELHLKLRKLMELSSSIDRIAIIDLGVNADLLFYIEKLLDEAHRMGIHIEWYDHHIWSEEWIHRINRLAKLVVDTSTCATGVVYNELAKDTKFNEMLMRFVDIVCDADLWKFNRWETPFFYRYVDYKDSDEWRYSVFKLFTESLRSNDLNKLLINMINVVERYVDIELETLSKLCKETFSIYIHGTRVGIYFREKNIPNASIIGNAMLNLCGVDIALVVNRELNGISLRSKYCNVREIAVQLNGGGHPRAAGAPLRIPYIAKPAYRIPLLNYFIRKYIRRYIIKKLRRIAKSRGSLCIKAYT